LKQNHKFSVWVFCVFTILQANAQTASWQDINTGEQQYEVQTARMDDSSEDIGMGMQDYYENNEPVGTKIDELEVKKLADKLDFTEKEKAKDTNSRAEKNQLAKKPAPKESRSFWLGEAGKTVAYTIAILALIAFVVYLIFNMGKSNLKKDKIFAMVESSQATDAYNLAEMPLDELLAQAMDQKDYRMAIRLLYLNSLKLLMEKGFIQPSPEKTNLEYASELEGNVYQEEFLSTTKIFENIWYGESVIMPSEFQPLKNKFSNFQTHILLAK